MTASLRSVASWRRMLLVGITALTASLAISFGAPQDAQAFLYDNTVPAQHKGWVYTKSIPFCQTPGACAMPIHDAWSWSGSAWRPTGIPVGLQVYVYPYSGSWHWIWTQPSGWLAIQNSKLERNRLSCGYLCA